MNKRTDIKKCLENYSEDALRELIRLGEEKAQEIENNNYKRSMLVDKEKELLAALYSDPSLKIELFSKISLEMISETHQEIFLEIAETEQLDDLAILHIMKKYDYQFLNYVMDLATTKAPNIPNRIKEYFDIYDSIKLDEFLNETSKEGKTSLAGLDLLESLKNNLDSELNRYSRFEKILTFNESIPGILERLEQKLKKDSSIKTISFPSFNAATGGLNEGNLIGIAGAFKNGKTTFGLNLVLDIASQNIPAAIFSLEMTKDEIQEKILSYKTGISYEKIRNPQRLTDEEKKLLIRFSNQKQKESEKLFIYDRTFTITEIEATVKKLVAGKGIKIVLIDYIGLIKPTFKHKSNESREREISQLSNSLKILSKESETIIFVLSQLNRSGLKEASSINLAESIGLARDCDFLFTIYKPDLNGYTKIKISDKEISVTGNDFVVKLDSSRHTQSGKEFLLRLDDGGKMKELETRFDNSYIKDFTVNEKEEVF